MAKSPMKKKGNIIAIVQARISASRLPNKVMLPLCGHRIIDWVMVRVTKSRKVDKVVFAIPKGGQDDALAKYLETLGALIFRGNERDVVERFFLAAKKYQATHIVRVCADNPFICSSEIDHLVQFYMNNNFDYAYNHIPRNNRFPDGLGAEIVSFPVLKSVHQGGTNPDHREHVFNYIWSHPERFKIGTFDPEDDRLAHPELKLDIDTEEDYQRFSQMKVDIEMEAHEIVEAARGLGKHETP